MEAAPSVGFWNSGIKVCQSSLEMGLAFGGRWRTHDLFVSSSKYEVCVCKGVTCFAIVLVYQGESIIFVERSVVNVLYS